MWKKEKFSVVQKIHTVVIFNMKKENREVCFDFVNSSLLSDSKARLILFPDEKQQFEVLSYLRSGNLKTRENFRVEPLMFHSRSMSTSNDFDDNVRFAVLFGTFSVLYPPITYCNSSLHKLLNKGLHPCL